jgi:hypothetical protein
MAAKSSAEVNDEFVILVSIGDSDFTSVSTAEVVVIFLLI